MARFGRIINVLVARTSDVAKMPAKPPEADEAYGSRASYPRQPS